jgi:hypothetical protein
MRRAARLLHERLNQGDAEGGGFPATGSGTRQHVAAFEGRRDRGELNGGGFGEPEVGDGAQELRRNAQVEKSLDYRSSLQVCAIDRKRERSRWVTR